MFVRRSDALIINENIEENLPELKNMNVQIEKDHQRSSTTYKNTHIKTQHHKYQETRI